jgi:hypothetical protein
MPIYDHTTHIQITKIAPTKQTHNYDIHTTQSTQTLQPSYNRHGRHHIMQNNMCKRQSHHTIRNVHWHAPYTTLNYGCWITPRREYIIIHSIVYNTYLKPNSKEYSKQYPSANILYYITT